MSIDYVIYSRLTLLYVIIRWRRTVATNQYFIKKKLRHSRFKINIQYYTILTTNISYQIIYRSFEINMQITYK